MSCRSRDSPQLRLSSSAIFVSLRAFLGLAPMCSWVLAEEANKTTRVPVAFRDPVVRTM
jgi:hypothetical protein